VRWGAEEAGKGYFLGGLVFSELKLREKDIFLRSSVQ